MRKLLNTLFVTSEDAYLTIDGENVVVNREKQEVARFPLHTLSGIISFSYAGASPALMGGCARRGVSLSFCTPTGRFLARSVGEENGNVLLRRMQYRAADDPAHSCRIARNMIFGKLHNARWSIERTKRDHALRVDIERLQASIDQIKALYPIVAEELSMESLRGSEGIGAKAYFDVFDKMILQNKADFYFRARSRRPPLDNVNALLSFAYSLLANDCAAALEAVGLDAYVGFLHRDRPGRTSLALDLMEELRPCLADRFVLSLINNRVLQAGDFEHTDSGAVLLTDAGRKKFLQAWQARKRETITHPYLKEKLAWGLVPYVQALLLKMAQTTGEISEAMLTYIASVPARDILNIGKASAQQALNIGFKNRSFAEGTPLLLRCCVAMDDKDGTATAQQFVDGVSRLLYAAADVDGDMSGNELNFITAYAGGLRTFLMTRAAGRHYNGAQEAARRVDIPGENQPKVGNEKTNPTNEKQTETKPEEKEETLDELMEQLDSLIGLDTVKHEVRSLINLIKVRAMRKKHDLKVMNMSFHMVFTGNPGTGKTTVARLVAKIYKQLGFLSKGQLIETDRSGLVAGYVGQTAGKVTDVVNSALGGILFIDEAYALARKGMDNDFGHEAIDTLVKLMEDHRDDLVVIVAGYSDEMHDFLTSNPGLISRFNKYIDFPDYTDDELMAILEMNAKRQGYRVTDEGKDVVRHMLTAMTLSERMDFGNARGMRNTLEKLVQAQANRLAVCEGEITREMLEEITGADAKTALVGEEEQKQADSENVAQLAEKGEQE